MVLKMAIFYQVDYIDIEPTLIYIISLVSQHVFQQNEPVTIEAFLS